MATEFTPSFLKEESKAITGMGVALTDSMWQMLMHPEDRQVIKALEAVPALSSIFKFVQDKALEKYARAQLIGDAIRLGPNQMPSIYKLLVDVCQVLHIKDVPEFYLRMDRMPNAYTQGESHPLITITTGLIEVLSEDDIRIVLAHECGHILFKHLRYRLASKVVFAGADSILGKMANMGSLGAITALEQLLYKWQRMAEYSADRVGMLYAGNLKDAMRVQLQLAGGLKAFPDEINMDEYVRQSDDFERMFAPNKVDGIIANLTLINQGHPYTSSRCIELSAFSKTSNFRISAHKLGTYRCTKCGGKMISHTMCENGHFC